MWYSIVAWLGIPGTDLEDHTFYHVCTGMSEADTVNQAKIWVRTALMHGTRHEILTFPSV